MYVGWMFSLTSFVAVGFDFCFVLFWFGLFVCLFVSLLSLVRLCQSLANIEVDAHSQLLNGPQGTH